MKFKSHLFVVILFFLIMPLNASHLASTPDAGLKDLVLEWNKAHTTKSAVTFSKLYDASVSFYGQKLSKAKSVELKQSALKSTPDYSQIIQGEIKIEMVSFNVYKCSFSKKVTAKGKTKEYPSYLIFEKKNQAWVIICESDDLTDNVLAKKKEKLKIPKDAIEGDYDGDGVKEFMWLESPKLVDEEMDCEGECNCYIVFSNPKLPKIKVESCIGGYPSADNLRDLNDDGSDEVGFYPAWFSSCWRGYYVWSFKNGKWICPIDQSIMTHCQQWENGEFPIEKDKNKKGYVTIRYSDWTKDENGDLLDIVTMTKSVKIK